MYNRYMRTCEIYLQYQATKYQVTQQPGRVSNGPNWKAIGTLALGALVLRALSKSPPKSAPALAGQAQEWPFQGHSTAINGFNTTTPAPWWISPRSIPTGSGIGQADQFTNSVRWVLGGAAALYGVKKLLDYEKTVLATAPAPAPTPAPPAPTRNSYLASLVGEAFREALSQPTTPTWTPPADTRWLSLAPHPSVILVLGKRGSGKSALGYRLLELFRNQAAPYVVGLPHAARKLLPAWVGCADRLDDVPPKAVVLLDESYIKYHARDSMSDEGRTLGQLVNLSRQRQQSLIFIVQEARQLDVNAISQADVIAVKELSDISREFERRELKRFTDKARVAFAGVKGNRQRSTWVYSEAVGEAGLVENELASFWKPALSRAFATATPDQHTGGAGRRKGAKTPKEELKARAKELRIQKGYSFGEIGKILGISKTLAWDLVSEPD